MIQHTDVRTRLALSLAVAFTLAAGSLSVFADPGELFPNVKPYDETVTAPISRPDRAVKITVTPVDPDPERPVERVKPVKVPKKNSKNPETAPATTEKSPETGVAKTPETPSKTERDVSFRPYIVALNQPLIDSADAAVFEKEYAEQITKALAGRVEDRRKLSGELATAAEQTKSEKLKRYLLLHSLGLAIRGGVPLEERTARANAVLPLLTDHTLSVTQARADCLNDLMLSVSLNPTDKMLDLYADSFASLARMQVQAGFPKDAQESLKKAREAFNKCKEKTPGRSEQVIESTAWVDRANMAAALWPRWQQTLKSTPDDPFANTQCALLHMALYGNPEQAQHFAAKSDKKDLQKLSAAIKAAEESEEARRDPLKVYTTAIAIADVSRTVAVNSFDKYSLAVLAGNKIELLIDSGQLPAEKTNEARKQLDLLREQVEKGGIKPGDPAKWLGGGKVDAKAKPADDPKKPIVGILELFKEIPKGTMPKPTDGMASVKATNDWLAANAVGKKIILDAAARDVGQEVVREDGSKYIPVRFTMNRHDVQGCVFTVEIESRMAPAIAERAGFLQYGEIAKIGGTIISARLTHYGAEAGYLRIVIGEKP